MASFTSSGPASIYCQCVICREYLWHSGLGHGLVKCGKCGATHNFSEFRHPVPPRRKTSREIKPGRLFT